MSVKVMLVDDDENILTSVSILLESEGFEVKTFTDGMSALLALAREQYDLFVLDIKVPRMDGVELLRRIRVNSDTPVIFLTSKDDENDEVTGLSLGADDYIKKPFSQNLLIQRIRAVLRRADATGAGAVLRKKSTETAYVRGDLTLDPLEHSCRWKDKQIPVTVTEFLILETLVKIPGHVKTRDSLMDAAYNDDVYVDDRTVDSHIKRLRKKFRMVDSNFNAVQTLYGIGYKWDEA